MIVSMSLITLTTHGCKMSLCFKKRSLSLWHDTCLGELFLFDGARLFFVEDSCFLGVTIVGGDLMEAWDFGVRLFFVEDSCFLGVTIVGGDLMEAWDLGNSLDLVDVEKSLGSNKLSSQDTSESESHKSMHSGLTSGSR